MLQAGETGRPVSAARLRARPALQRERLVRTEGPEQVLGGREL